MFKPLRIMIKLPLFSALLFGKLEQRASKPFAYNHWLFFVSNKPLPLLSHPHGISVTVLKSHEKMRTFACFYSKHLSHSIHYFHIRHKFAALKHIFLALGHFFFFFQEIVSTTCLPHQSKLYMTSAPLVQRRSSSAGYEQHRTSWNHGGI